MRSVSCLESLPWDPYSSPGVWPLTISYSCCGTGEMAAVLPRAASEDVRMPNARGRQKLTTNTCGGATFEERFLHSWVMQLAPLLVIVGWIRSTAGSRPDQADSE